MSGSEDDIFLFGENMCNSESTTFGVKGPNINKSISWKGSEYNPRFQPNFNRSRYVTSFRDSTLFRRDTSPMSVRSAFAMPNYHLNHQNGQNYPRSMCGNSGRGGFPVSLRSSVSKSTCNEAAKKVLIAFSEAEIALIYEKEEFHKNDLRLMKYAYRKFMKLSREQMKRSNFSTYNRQSDREYSSSCTTNDSSCDDDPPRVNRRKKKLPRPSKSSNLSSRQITSKCTTNLNSENCKPSTFGNISLIPPLKETSFIRQQNVALPKDRFKKGYDLPCQRFNQSVVSSVINEDNENLLHNTQSAPANAHAMNKHCNIDSGTDSDEENNCENRLTDKNKSGVKRTHDEEDVNMPNKKRFKKNGSKDTNEQVNEDDFIFAKPMFPVHKSANRKQREESLISSTLCSPKTLYAGNSSKSDLSKHTNQTKDVHVNEDELNETESEGNKSISNMSQRPSFIKRKLFTQNLELAEKRNISTDNIQSPHIGHSVKQKDKFKPRKLTNTQYCLTRDVNQEDGNLLDLISKIVPVENINKTNLNATATKKSKPLGRSKSNLDIKNKKRNLINSSDDWDITSVISTCDLDNASDTYTDEDIIDPKNDNAAIDKYMSKQCEKFPPKKTTNEEVENIKQKNNITNPTQKNDQKKDALNIYKSFWDTDPETDFESPITRKSRQSEKLPSEKTTNEEVENVVQKNNITNPSQKNGLKKDVLNICKSFWDTDSGTDFESSNTPVKKRINSTERIAATQKQSVCNQVKNIESVLANSNKSNSILNIDTCNFVLRSQRTPKRKYCCEHDAESQILHKKNMSVTPPINENIKKNPKVPAPKINENEKHQDTNKPSKQKSNSTVENVNTKKNQKNNIKSISKNTAANAGTKKTSKAIEEINKPITNKNIESKNIEAKKKTTKEINGEKDKTVASNTKEAVDTTNKSKSKTKDPVLINNSRKQSNIKLTQLDLTNFEVSRSLRSREISSNSLVCLENNKKNNSKSTKSEANKLQKSILSFAIKENSNENDKVVNKKQSSKNKMLLNTSVQTRRTVALNKTKNNMK